MHSSTNMADSSNERPNSPSNSSDLSHDSASDYSSESGDSSSGSDDEGEPLLGPPWSRIYPPEEVLAAPHHHVYRGTCSTISTVLCKSNANEF